MKTEKFLPNAALVATLAKGYCMILGSNCTSSGKALGPINPEIMSVGEYIDSQKNSELSTHRKAYIKAVEALLGSPDTRESDVMDTFDPKLSADFGEAHHTMV